MKPYLLQEEEIKELSAKIPGWEIHQKYIERNLNFHWKKTKFIASMLDQNLPQFQFLNP